MIRPEHADLLRRMGTPEENAVRDWFHLGQHARTEQRTGKKLERNLAPAALWSELTPEERQHLRDQYARVT